MSSSSRFGTIVLNRLSRTFFSILLGCDEASIAHDGGMLFTNSGYGVFGGAPGNVLLAFSVE
jgi:hypothetical protein